MRLTTELTGRYHLEELIAAGGMGEVWRAVDQVLARPVAVKLLRPEYTRDAVTLARFRAEARHAGLLNHPGIAQVYDYCDASPESPAYLVMELVAGPSLAGVLAAGRLEPARAADVLAQAAAALGAAHAAGVVHRDIKPGNLLITHDGQVKVTDFGIAHSARTEDLTSTGALIGTMGYLAPERVCGGLATAASDLYALGIVGYECLTGQPPFRGEPLQVALAHREQELPGFPPGCLRQPGGTELAALIRDLTAKDPAARPATAAGVAARACRIRDGLAGRAGMFAAPTAAGEVTPAGDAAAAGRTAAGSATREDGSVRSIWPAAAPGPGRRRRMAATLALTAGIVAAGLLGWQLATAQDSPAQPRPVSSGRHPAGRPAQSAASARTVNVSTSLAGRPVTVVRRDLQALGLVAQVRTHQDGQAAPGSVLRLYPTGRVQAGSVILLTVAAPPPSARRGSPAPPPGGAAGGASAGGHVPPGHAKHGKAAPPGHGRPTG